MGIPRGCEAADRTDDVDVLTRARSLRTVVDGGKPAPELEKSGKEGEERNGEGEGERDTRLLLSLARIVPGCVFPRSREERGKKVRLRGRRKKWVT